MLCNISGWFSDCHFSVFQCVFKVSIVQAAPPFFYNVCYFCCIGVHVSVCVDTLFIHIRIVVAFKEDICLTIFGLIQNTEQIREWKGWLHVSSLSIVMIVTFVNCCLFHFNSSYWRQLFNHQYFSDLSVKILGICVVSSMVEHNVYRCF